MNLGYQQIAWNLNVSLSTVHNLIQKFYQTGEVCSVTRKRRPETRKLSDQEELYVIDFVLDNPSVYLGEVCGKLEEVYRVVVSPPTICRLLRAYGLTRKKIQQVALQRCYTLRGAYLAHCSLFNLFLLTKLVLMLGTMSGNMGMLYEE